MTNEKDFLKVKVEKLVNLVGFQCECFISESLDTKTDARIFNCKIEIAEGSNFLIGQYGTTLQALESILRNVAFKSGIKERVILDVNDYRESKKNGLKRLASEIAEQVARERKPQILRPMSPFERRTIHLFLEDDDRVQTESIGEGEERKLVIKPKSFIDSL